MLDFLTIKETGVTELTPIDFRGLGFNETIQPLD